MSKEEYLRKFTVPLVLRPTTPASSRPRVKMGRYAIIENNCTDHVLRISHMMGHTENLPRMRYVVPHRMRHMPGYVRVHGARVPFVYKMGPALILIVVFMILHKSWR
ncbi:MAG: hypothetical protein CL902_00660 [Dehalococcoidia bacterium]|nr:hypothetical protein [Dehalococcoidia bacterium]